MSSDVTIFDRFVDTHQIETEMTEALEKKQFERASELLKVTEDLYEQFRSNPEIQRCVICHFLCQN